MAHNPLGQQTEYISRYSPELLFPISRADSRRLLNLPVATASAGALPFRGADLWTGYEISWLDNLGKPQVAVAEFVLPCESDYMVESKSFKLYLNSFNQTRLADRAELHALLVRDLSAVAGTPVAVSLFSLHEPSPLASIHTLPGYCLDDLPVAIDTYHPHPDYLCCEASDTLVEETLYSQLLKTNCPVTGQPDWASVQVSYKGRALNREGLLRYLVSFREHQDFHEHCVERIFMDIWQRCAPESLSIYARYTRRGGLDINPLRTSEPVFNLPSNRLLRQ